MGELAKRLIFIVIGFLVVSFQAYPLNRIEYDWENLKLNGKITKLSVKEFGVRESFGEYVKSNSPNKDITYFFNSDGTINTVLLKQFDNRADYDKFVYDNGKLSVIYQLNAHKETKYVETQESSIIVVDTLGRIEYSYENSKISEINYYEKGGYNNEIRLEKKIKYQYIPTGYIKKTFNGDGSLNEEEILDGKTKTVKYGQSSIVNQLNDDLKPLNTKQNMVGSNASVNANLDYEYNEYGDVIFRGIKSDVSLDGNKTANARVVGRNGEAQNYWKYVYDEKGNWTDMQYFRNEETMDTWTTRTFTYASSDNDFNHVMDDFKFSDENVKKVNDAFNKIKQGNEDENAEIEFFTKYFDDINKKFFVADDYYRLSVKNDNGSIKKCTIDNDAVSFETKSEKLAGKFSRIKYGYKQFTAYKDEAGKLIVYIRPAALQNQMPGKKIAILIVRNGEDNVVYNLQGDALKAITSNYNEY